MKTDQFPPISSELLDALDKTCPGKMPQHEISPFEQGKIVGAVELIERLRRVHQTQFRKAM